MEYCLPVFLFCFLASISGHAKDLEIIHLNIGQGDATLLLGPTIAARKAVLI